MNAAVPLPPVSRPGQHVDRPLRTSARCRAPIEAVERRRVAVALAVKDDRGGALAGTEVAVEGTNGRGIQRYRLAAARTGDGPPTLRAARGEAERIQRREVVARRAIVPGRLIARRGRARRAARPRP